MEGAGGNPMRCENAADAAVSGGMPEMPVLDHVSSEDSFTDYALSSLPGSVNLPPPAVGLVVQQEQQAPPVTPPPLLLQHHQLLQQGIRPEAPPAPRMAMGPHEIIMGQEIQTVKDLAHIPSMTLKRQNEWDGDRFVPYAVFSSREGEPVGVIDLDDTHGSGYICGCSPYTATLRSAATGRALVDMRHRSWLCTSSLSVTDLTGGRRRFVGKAVSTCCSPDVQLVDAQGREVGRLGHCPPDAPAANSGGVSAAAAAPQGGAGPAEATLEEGSTQEKSVFAVKDVLGAEDPTSVDEKLLLVAGIVQVSYAQQGGA